MPARQEIIVAKVAPLLEPGMSVLEIGAGSGKVSEALATRTGAQFTLLDVVDYNASSLPLKLYDGQRLPYPDNSFDAALFIFVLHHNPDPRPILNEALRVARREVIVVENDVQGVLRKSVTRWCDSVEPLRRGSPPCYFTKSSSEWLELFAGLDAKPHHVDTFNIGWFWRNAVFVITQ